MQEAEKIPKGYILWENYTLNTLSCDVEIDNIRTDFRTERKFEPIEKQIEKKKIPQPQDLTNGQLIWMMDQMIVRSMAWINGWPISHCFYDLAYEIMM